MTNPLNSGASFGPKSFAGMLQGETRQVTFTPKDKEPITRTITRTKRKFQYDWHDASNVELARKRSNYRWVPEFEGESFKLVDIRFVNPPDTPRWKPSQEEKDEAEREVSWALGQGMTMHEFKVWLSRRGQKQAA